MRRLFGWMVRWAAIFVLAGLAVAALRTLIVPLQKADGWDALFRSAALWSGVAGLVSRFLLTRWRRGDPLEFLDTLEHELTHALAGYLTFAPPVSLTATLRRGGEVQLTRTNPVVALAPYILPLFATATSALTLILMPALSSYGKMVVGFLLGSFAYRLGREFHLGQTDFREFGLIFSLVSVSVLMPLTLLSVLEMAGILTIGWKEAVWPIFLEQTRWLLRFASSRFS